ncbi:MAG: hypothetical protein M1840_003974 [Geoglossum simile]|nr:MAG: hypothetical protein M1840_003974 [Geoglossum simile]
MRIKAFGVNRMDLLEWEGQYPVPPQASKTLGVEFSGTIETLGLHITEKDFKIGDEVFGLAYGGLSLALPQKERRTYAEYVAVSAHMLIHKPKEMTWEEVAGTPEACIRICFIGDDYLSFGNENAAATQALYLVGEFSPGKSVFWHAGASSVSSAGIQLSKYDGASAVYVTASSREKIDFIVNVLGATQGFNYKEQDIAKEIKKSTGPD